MHRVLAHKAVRHSIAGVGAGIDILNVQRCPALVEMVNNPLQQALILVRVKNLQTILPPDIVFDLRPGNGERIIDRSASAGWVGVVQKRTAHAHLRGERLLVVGRPADAGAASVIRNRLVE